MPTLPQVQLREEAPRQPAVRIQPGALGGLGKGLQIFGEALQAAQDQQDSFEIKRQGVLLDTKLDELKEEIKAEPDFAKRDKLYQEKSAEYLATATQEISSPRVRNGLNQYYSLKFPQEALKVRVGNQKEWGEHRVAQTAELADLMADKIVSSDNPRDVEKYKALYNDQLNVLSIGPYAPLNAVKRQQMEKDFSNKVLSKRAQRMINEVPESFLVAADEGQFKDLTEDQVYKFRSMARGKIEADERANDRVAKEVKDLAMNSLQASANKGEISAADMADMLAGRNPYVTAAQARTLNEVNNNPPTGAGGDNVRAIMQEYHAGPSSFGRIRAARAQLRSLMQSQGSPNPLLDKALNELQTDERTMTGIEASRVNREIQAAQDSYTANTPPLPFNFPLFNNQRTQDKAKIADTIRKGGDPKAIIDKKKNEAKQRQDAIPERNKKVLDLVK